jgi:hypothetical protein
MPKDPAAADPQPDTPNSTFKPPLKPRRGLFYLFMGLFVLWLLALVAMFLTTVYPHPETDIHRRASHTPSPTATDQ